MRRLQVHVAHAMSGVQFLRLNPSVPLGGCGSLAAQKVCVAAKMQVRTTDLSALLSYCHPFLCDADVKVCLGKSGTNQMGQYFKARTASDGSAFRWWQCNE